MTRIHTKLPVYSVVIYLREDKRLVESPYVIRLADGRPTQRLDFDTIKLWELDPEVFEQQELVGLLPLLPLTKGGKNRATVPRMIEGLAKAGRQDLLMVGYAFSELVFTAEGDSEWLKASFFMQHDFLKNTWVFQQVLNEGKEEGKQEGIQVGKQEGKQEGLQEALERQLTRFVELRFPALLALAKQTIGQKKSVEQLQIILDKLYQVYTIEEAQAALLTSD